MVTGEGQIGTLPEVPQGPHSSIGNGQIVAYSPLQVQRKDSVTLVQDLSTWLAEEFARELDKSANILEVADDSERNPYRPGSLAIDTMAKVLLGES